jgi:uncharacterized protein (TIGR03067 family)
MNHMRKSAYGALAAFFLAGAAALGVAAEQDKGEASADLKKLEGTWEVVSLINGGEEVAELKEIKVTFVFKGDKLTVRKRGEEKVMEATIVLDTTTMPRLIDLTKMMPDKGKDFQGIYELKDDDLKICVHNGGRERPTEFAAKADNREQGLFTLKRVKQ